jgi:hypothetical protein
VQPIEEMAQPVLERSERRAENHVTGS